MLVKENKFIKSVYLIIIILKYIPKIKTKSINLIKNTDEIENHFQAELEQIIASNMDTTINPCDDFYEYACGNWYKNLDINKQYLPFPVNYFIGPAFSVNKQIEDILNNINNSKFHKYQQILSKVKKYYNSCLNTKLLPPKRITEYIEYIKSIGGFPAADDLNWSPDNFNWIIMTANCDLFGINSFFSTKVSDISPFQLLFDTKSYFGLGGQPMELNDFKYKTINYQENYELMKFYLNIYGSNIINKSDVIEEIMNFGLNIVNLTKSMEHQDFQMSLMIKDAINELTKFDFHKYFQIYFNQLDFDQSKYITINTKFYNPDLFQYINNSKQEIIANYLSLKLLHNFHVEFRKSKYDFCVNKIINELSIFLAPIYLDTNFSIEIKEDLMKIFVELKESLKQNINSTKWLDESSRMDAIKKAEHIQIHLGYVNDSIVKNISELIDNLRITDNFYLNNIECLKMKTYLEHYNFHIDHTLTNFSIKTLNPLDINAFYDSFKNAVLINVILFQIPFYNYNYPLALKYGAIGHTIGHEMNHAFDSQSISFNFNGDIKHWMNKNVTAEYAMKMICFSNQYSKYYIPEVNLWIDGLKTLPENIADNGGLRIAYKAYKNVIGNLLRNGNKNIMVTKLSNITENQLFFLGYAQKFCSIYKRKQFLKEKDSLYPFIKIRVNGAIENFDEFSKVFNCPLGTNMNPAIKCVLF